MNLKNKILSLGLCAVVAVAGVFVAGGNTVQAEDLATTNTAGLSIDQLQQLVLKLQEQIAYIIQLLTQQKPVCGNGVCETAKGETATTCSKDCDTESICGRNDLLPSDGSRCMASGGILGCANTPCATLGSTNCVGAKCTCSCQPACAKEGSPCSISKCGASNGGWETKCIGGGSNCCAGLTCAATGSGWSGTCVKATACAKEGEYFWNESEKECCSGLAKTRKTPACSQGEACITAEMYTCAKTTDACAKEGEKIYMWIPPVYGLSETPATAPMVCCAGLTAYGGSNEKVVDGKCVKNQYAGMNMTKVCIKCGDGVCNASAGENICSCAQDCPGTANQCGTKYGTQITDQQQTACKASGGSINTYGSNEGTVYYCKCCTDSDGGLSYYQKGTLTTVGDGTGTYYDTCSADNAKVVKEWSCNNMNNPVSTEFTCPNGCKDGACIADSTALTELVPFAANVSSCTTNTGEVRPTTGTTNYATWFIWNNCAKEKQYKVASTDNSGVAPNPIVLSVSTDSESCGYPDFTLYRRQNGNWYQVSRINTNGANRDYLYPPATGVDAIKIVANSCFYLRIFQGGKDALAQKFPNLTPLAIFSTVNGTLGQATGYVSPVSGQASYSTSQNTQQNATVGGGVTGYYSVPGSQTGSGSGTQTYWNPTTNTYYQGTVQSTGGSYGNWSPYSGTMSNSYSGNSYGSGGTTSYQVESTGGSWGGWSPGI